MKTAKEMILTARMVTPDEAERWGLVNRVTPEGELFEAGLSLAEEIILCAPLAVSSAKSVVNQISDIDRGLQLEALAQTRLIQTDDFSSGVESMLAKSTPQWNGK